MNRGQGSSYASKVSRKSSAEKKTVTIQEPVKNKDAGVSSTAYVDVPGEKLLASASDLMRDEGVRECHDVPQVSNVHQPQSNPIQEAQPQFVETNPPQMMSPGPMMMQSPTPGYYNMMAPPQVYGQGSPPLPLPGPLHLVYLQPTPHGVNIIPFQAAGFPTYSPVSPLGFPAHPHHPVVVQSPQQFHNPGPDGAFPPVSYDANGIAYFPNNGYPVNGGVCVPPQEVPIREQSITHRSPKMFRPWEDKSEEEKEKTPTKSKVAFVEEDFPSLQTGLAKLNVK